MLLMEKSIVYKQFLYYLLHLCIIYNFSSFYNYVNKFPDFYREISEKGDVSSGTYKSDCQKFIDDNIRVYAQTDTTFLNTCAKIVHHLDQKKGTDELKPAFCKYINYWIYHTLHKTEQFSHEKLLQQFYSKTNKLNDCKDYYNSFKEKTYNELKELYELYKDFNEFKKESTQGSTGSCSHGEKCVEIYERIVDNCKWNTNNFFCMKLKVFREEYETHKTDNKKCTDLNKYLTPVGSNPLANFLSATLAMSIITFVFIYFYKFTSFGSWLRPRLPGGKNKTNKLDKKMQELQNTSENEGRQYKLPYHSPYS